eukprot:768372-Hanusia_phi.AAC.7
MPLCPQKPPPECSRFLNIGERQWIISYLADLSNFKSMLLYFVTVVELRLRSNMLGQFSNN